MNGVICHDSALVRLYIGPGITWADEMNFVMNHAPGAGFIASPVNQQSSVLPLYHRCPPGLLHNRPSLGIQNYSGSTNVSLTIDSIRSYPLGARHLITSTK